MNCSVKRCTRPALPNGKCRRCYLREWRRLNKMKYAYQTSKDNAKRRGKEFDITLEEYAGFAVESKYIIGKGRTATSLHIDRIEEDKGYTLSNMQVLPNKDNVIKYLRWSHDQKGKPYHFVNEIIHQKKTEAPF